jgi:ferric-dicitrate binding protein FerR (iron transport regulator)
MDDLLVKYLLQEATAHEKLQVEQWIAESRANKKQFDDFVFLWNECRKAAATSTVDETLAWKRFQQKINEPRPSVAIIPMPRKFNWMRVAAAVLVLIAGSWFLSTLFTNNNTGKIALVQTQQNILADTLPDGSVVTLNKHSSIEYNTKFTKGKTRSVKLKGEAFFTVTANNEKPFVIAVNDIEVRVVGTSFNIKTIDGRTEVIVKTGIVEVTRNGKTIRLTPNEKTITPLADSSLAKTNITDKLYNYYQSKEFACDNTPLWRLVEVLNEAYNVNIVIARKELRSLPLTTTFNNESLENILDIISKTFQVQVVKKEKQIILQ